MSRLVFAHKPPSPSEADYTHWVLVAAAPAAVNSVSARVAYGLSLSEALRLQLWSETVTEIELCEAGLDLLVAVNALLSALPVADALVTVCLSDQGRADVETPFGREVMAKFRASLEASGAASVSC